MPGSRTTPPWSGARGAMWYGIAAAAIAIAAGIPGLNEIGVTWDEPRYFASVERIQDWTARLFSGEAKEALSPVAIRDAWDQDRYFNPHPPVYKEGMAATDALFGRQLGTPGAYRLSSLLAFGLLLGLVTSIGVGLMGPVSGLTAGLSLLLMPRVFGHAHIGATDIPLTLFWFAATIGVFLYVSGGRRRWLMVAGIGLGLGMATKFTAFLAPVPLIVWMVLQARTRRSLVALACAGLLAAAVAVIVNPAAWSDPLEYQVRLFRESLSRDASVPISTYYLGRVYGYVVPWHHAIVMTAATLPVATVSLAALGLRTAVLRGRLRPLAVLCVIQVGFWMSLLALPGSPNHDGVRLWLPMFPFVAILAGSGFGILADVLGSRVRGRTALGLLALGVLYFFPMFLGAARSSPYYLSYYGEVIGGPKGAAESGMEATYWFDAITRSFRDAVNDAMPDSATVVVHPNHEYYEQLQALGLLRPDLAFRAEPPADYLILLGRKALFDDAWTSVYRSARPELSVQLDGVELAGLYEWNESATAPPAAAGETP